MSDPKININAVTGSQVGIARCTDGGANAGKPTELTCSTAGALNIAGTVTVDTSLLATSALQTSVGATAHADSAAILAKIIASPATEATLLEIDQAALSIDATMSSLLAAVKPFTTFVALTGSDQTPPVGMRGFNITTAGVVKVDCSGVVGGLYGVALGTNLLSGVTKVYGSGTTAVGSIVS